MTILVCGGRDFARYTLLKNTLDEYLGRVTKIVHGGARGADSMADQWAEDRDVEVRCYQAEWHKYGMQAGVVRNQQMLEAEKPDLVIAFPGGRGTADMVSRAKKAGVEVREIK